MSEKLRPYEMIIENPTSDPECPEARRADFGAYGSHLLDLPRPLPPSDFKSVDRQCGEVTASDADGPTHDFVRTYDERSRSAWKRLRHCAESSSASLDRPMIKNECDLITGTAEILERFRKQHDQRWKGFRSGLSVSL